LYCLVHSKQFDDDGGGEDDDDDDELLATMLTIKRKRLILLTCRLDHLSVYVCLSVRKVYCDKTVDWIQMPFGMVSGVGRGIGASDGAVIAEGKGQFGVNFGHPTVTNGDFATRLFTDYFGQDLLMMN